MILGTSGGLAIQAKGAMWLGFAINLIWAALMLIAFRFFLLSRGAWGLSVTHAVSALCLGLFVQWYVAKAGYYPWRLAIRTALACTALLAVAFGPLYLSPGVRLAAGPMILLVSLAVAWMLLPERVALVAGRGARALFRKAAVRQL